MLGKLIKFLLFLAVLGFMALVAYAYVGPYFGATFEPAQTQTRVPVTLGSK